MSSQDQNSESQISRGKHDPGWNDPPTFSYNPQATTVKPKLALNKRVAFPLSGNTSNSQIPVQLPPSAPINPLLPVNPTSQFVTSIPNPIVNVPLSANNENSGENIDVNEVVNMLNEILESNQELGNKLEDIRKRIDIMKTMWIEEKLPPSVQVLTAKLVRALRDSDTATADEIHKSLMVDHVGCVRTWMVAIKQLIFHCAAKNDLLQIDESEKREDS